MRWDPAPSQTPCRWAPPAAVLQHGGMRSCLAGLGRRLLVWGLVLNGTTLLHDVFCATGRSGESRCTPILRHWRRRSRVRLSLHLATNVLRSCTNVLDVPGFSTFSTSPTDKPERKTWHAAAEYSPPCFRCGIPFTCSAIYQWRPLVCLAYAEWENPAARCYCATGKRRIEMRTNTSPIPRREMKPLQLVGLVHRRLIVFCAPIAAAGLGTGHRELTWGALILVGVTSIFVIFRPILLARTYTELNSCPQCNHDPNGLSAEPPTPAAELPSG
jgi:hypothetical protein